MSRWLWLLLGVGLIGWWLAPSPPRARAAGIVAATAPLQAPPRDAAAFTHDDFRITPLAEFSLQARVLSREDYHLDAESALSPTDLALGWGRMSDSAVIEQLQIAQSARWYRYRWDAAAPPLPPAEMAASSANMHLLPANARVATALKRVRVGDVVALRGRLVEVDRSDGWRWRSSLTRTDVGGGACEVVWVEELSTL